MPKNQNKKPVTGKNQPVKPGKNQPTGKKQPKPCYMYYADNTGKKTGPVFSWKKAKKPDLAQHYFREVSQLS
jgi:hypothetical protein